MNNQILCLSLYSNQMTNNNNLKNQIMSKFNLVVENLQNSLKSNGVEVSDSIVVDFLNEYIDENEVEDGDFIESDGILMELSDYVSEM